MGSESLLQGRTRTCLWLFEEAVKIQTSPVCLPRTEKKPLPDPQYRAWKIVPEGMTGQEASRVGVCTG